MRKLITNSISWLSIVPIVMLAHGFLVLHTNDPEWMQRGGATLIIVGIAIAARPFFRAGLTNTVNQQMPKHPGAFVLPAANSAKFREQIERVRPEIFKDVMAERVTGVTIIVIGTLLSGYGDLPFRWFGYG